MSIHSSRINWQRAVHPLDKATYNRNHIATLNGNQAVAVSASEEFKGDPACAEPEQMLVSAVSSCHMLFFLAIAERQGVTIESYKDRAIGHLEMGPGGGLVITRVELHPEVVYGAEQRPDAATIDRIHAAAHKSCFIGNSITADVVVHARSWG